jgi:hypothetical protein
MHYSAFGSFDPEVGQLRACRLPLKGAVKHALRTRRSNKAVLGSIEDGRGDPACFYYPKKISKSAVWPAGASVFIPKSRL